MRRITHVFGVLAISWVVFACGNSSVKTDSTTSGNMTILVDESFYPIINYETEAFQNRYVNTVIQLEAISQEDAISQFLKGNTDMIVVSRVLTNSELESVRQKNFTVAVNKVATDAIGLLVNEKFSDSFISTAQLRKIIEGEITRWNQLSPSLPDEEISIVVDRNSSGVLTYLKDELGLQIDKVKIYAAGSNSKVLEFVKNNPGQLGVIGVNWVSDEDDPRLNEKLRGLKLLAVSGDENDKNSFYQPIQENLWENRYPLVRTIYCINKTTKAGVGTGFASFLLSDPGQRIILKEGLLPAVMPGREIVVKK